ncbi:Uncharacterized membrane protein [Spirosomataceae bacterium TFI 002]|nr:Uncharacterized membrane protein [Spirosomataceae bacterium TFI 002]
MATNRVVRSIFSYFIRGLLFVAPIGFTIYILYSAFDFVDNLARIRFGTGHPNDSFFIPGLGFGIVIGVTVLIGFIFTRILPQTIQNWMESGIKNLPLVRIFYFAFKDLISAFVGDKKKFKQPVLFKMNAHSEVRKMGFMTQSSLEVIGKEEYVSIYCPHSYAFSGEMFVVPAADVELVNLGGSDAMKIIVSGGVSFKD